MSGTGRKRRHSQAVKDTSNASIGTMSQVNTSQSKKGRKKFDLSLHLPKVACDRSLTCGSGEQIGHPGRQTTRKPRAIDTFDENVRFVQACAGGVHSLLLTNDGKVYSCGSNEKGVVPVKNLDVGDITDTFTEIEFSPKLKKHGKIVQIVAGGSFGAALTDLGSVIAWGNFRDAQGDFTAHPQFEKMQHEPVIITKHNKVKVMKIAAGENHLVMLTSIGQVMTFGDASQGQLGRSSRPNRIRQNFLADETGDHLLVQILERGKLIKFNDVFAGASWTVLKGEDGRLFGCGLNNFGQLGMLPKQKRARRTMSVAFSQNGVQDEGDYNIYWPVHIKAFDSDSSWTHVAGATHLVLRNENGELYAVGKNIDNYLGLGTWTGREDEEHWRYHTLQKVIFPDHVKIAGVTASLGCTIAWTEEGTAYAFGYDGVGQLGLGTKDDDEDKVVPTPRRITSAHLDDYKIISVSLADQHAIFLAKHV